jgi:hypothetical protein
LSNAFNSLNRSIFEVDVDVIREIIMGSKEKGKIKQGKICIPGLASEY